MRNRWGLILMITLLVLVVGRLALLQGVDGAAYANAAEQDRLRTYPVAALRGEVLDRNGRPFAYTVEASRVVADPTVVDDPARTALALTTLLDVPVPELTEKLSENSRYVVLATQISPETVDAIEALELPGVLFEDDPVRLYPAGAVGRPGGRVRRPRGHRPRRHRADLRRGAVRHARASAPSRWAAAATRSRPASTSRRRPSTAAPCSSRSTRTCST